MLHTYCEALRGATHMAGCQCSLWASSGCSLSLVLCHSTSVSCVPVCDWLRDWALECATPLTSCMGGGKVCVWHRESEQEREKYTPFSFRAPSPSSPLAPWLLLGEFLSAYVCVCVCHSPAPGREAFSRRVHWLSHSYVRIRQIHLYFLTPHHSIFRHTCAVFGSRGQRTQEMRSFWCLCVKQDSESSN